MHFINRTKRIFWKIKLHIFYLYSKLFFRFLIPEKKTIEKLFCGVILKIGGNIDPFFEKMMKKSRRVITVNISNEYLQIKQKSNIQADAHYLPMINKNSVDVIVNSHLIEHLSNPIKALKEWKRILKPGGLLYCRIPYYKRTFDRQRSVTSLEHLKEDFLKDVLLNDQTHINEFLKNYDIVPDLAFSSYNEWVFNYYRNPIIYTHHHVFNLDNVLGLMEETGFKTIKIFYNSIHIEYFGIKDVG